jgi:3-hydroxybutyryl-CoA dehydratase
MTGAKTIASYCIEDLKVGQSASYRRVINDADVQKFGEVSGDMNPLHFDEDYAKNTVFRGRIVHGMLSVSFLSTVLGTMLPGAGSIFIGASVRFKAPVRIGDEVVATCSVREIDALKRRVVFDCICKVGDATVIEGEALVKVPTRAARGGE